MLIVSGMPGFWEMQRHSNEKCVLSLASNPDVSRERSQVGKLPAWMRKVPASKEKLKERGERREGKERARGQH